VEHEKASREVVVSMLSFARYECGEAGDGLEALALLDSGKEFDLVLSNLIMPNLDGIGLLERVRGLYPDIPVVILSAVQDISVVLATTRRGAYDYLLKPFEREELLATVRRALENRRLKLETRAYQTNLEALVQQRTNQLRVAINDLERRVPNRQLRSSGFGDWQTQEVFASPAARSAAEPKLSMKDVVSRTWPGSETGMKIEGEDLTGLKTPESLKYQLDCGRWVTADECYISESMIGIIVGHGAAIRRDVINSLTERVRRKWPNHIPPSLRGFYQKPVPEGRLPDYVFMVYLIGDQIVSDPDCHGSRLIVCWLSDDVKTSLPELIKRETRAIEWDKYAVDFKL
jgi:CheY-like chemotaxis protein